MGRLNFKSAAELEIDLMYGVKTGFIQKETESKQEIRPKLIYNNSDKNLTVLSVVKEELRDCNTFWFSVAFVSQDGMATLKQSLAEAAARGVEGRILTSNYLSFNSPKALRELLLLKNVEVRVFEGQLHTKGYCFTYCTNPEKTFKNLIVGSSNLTGSALKLNKEWNLRVSSFEEGEIVQEAEAEFESMWNEAYSLTEEWIHGYEAYYNPRQRILQSANIIPMEVVTLQPNSMQKEALESLAKLRRDGKRKALLISATGTGKTYLSAFDVRAVNPKRLLFIAHREQLLLQAMDSYKKVLGNSTTFGLVSGNAKEFDKNYIFATVQTLRKDDILKHFSPCDFDYIIVDEVHRAGAKSYEDVLNYFTPDFLLGMTATPERTDGKDIYQLFDHNIAYEIRLQKALESNLLCPFHYYGLSYDFVMNEDVQLNKAEYSQALVQERHVEYIVEQIKYYGFSGDRVRGLVFCATKDEAACLAKAFRNSSMKFRTATLTGDDSQQTRQETIDRLVGRNSQTGEDISNCECLDYIFTVDIFNEGVDIPSINQIVMIRPTESAIIFVQQLGRGLRKYVSPIKNHVGLYDKKDYLVVLDFIGNYTNNFLIPIALTGDKSYNKDDLRKHVSQADKEIPGLSSINFDEVARQYIYDAIDKSNLSSIAILKEAYLEVKQKLGRIPTISDFEVYGSVDVMKFFTQKSLGSYYAFLEKYDSEACKAQYTKGLNHKEVNILTFVCKKLANGKRRAELSLLMKLMGNEEVELDGSELLLANVEAVLTNQFIPNVNAKKIFEHAVLVERHGNIFRKTETFKKALRNSDFKSLLEEVLCYGLRRFETKYSHPYKNTSFVVGEKYTYEDVCRLLCWEKNIVALNIGGYKYDEKTNTFPVFINYKKGNDLQGSINYEDRFEADDYLIAYSKNKRTLASPEIDRLVKVREGKHQMKSYLFLRKNNNDGDQAEEFYFLGEINPTGKMVEGKIHSTTGVFKKEAKSAKDKKSLSIVEIHYKLDVPVRKDLYDYIIS